MCSHFQKGWYCAEVVENEIAQVRIIRIFTNKRSLVSTLPPSAPTITPPITAPNIRKNISASAKYMRPVVCGSAECMGVQVKLSHSTNDVFDPLP